MCDLCKKNEDSMYPDLGQGASMYIDIDNTWFTALRGRGIRIAQKRTVDYMGPEGVEKREETQCVYIGWDDVEDTLKKMLVLSMKEADREDPTD